MQSNTAVLMHAMHAMQMLASDVMSDVANMVDQWFMVFVALCDHDVVRWCCDAAVSVQLGTEGEVNFSLIGTLFGVASSAFVSLNAIFTKSCLDVVDGTLRPLCLLRVSLASLWLCSAIAVAVCVVTVHVM